MLLWVHRVRITCIPHLRLTKHVAEAEQASKTASPAKRRKKDLTESEIALRRAETARKRKDLSEKKLEDEKVRIDIYYCPAIATCIEPPIMTLPLARNHEPFA